MYSPEYLNARKDSNAMIPIMAAMASAITPATNTMRNQYEAEPMGIAPDENTCTGAQTYRFHSRSESMGTST